MTPSSYAISTQPLKAEAHQLSLKPFLLGSLQMWPDVKKRRGLAAVWSQARTPRILHGHMRQQHKWALHTGLSPAPVAHLKGVQAKGYREEAKMVFP